MSRMRLIIVEARPVRRQRLSALVSAEAQITLVASCASLMEAYTQIESEVPDLVLISRRMTDVPEHSMLLALLRLLGIVSTPVEDSIEDRELSELLRSQYRKLGPEQTSAADGPKPEPMAERGIAPHPLASFPLSISASKQTAGGNGPQRGEEHLPESMRARIAGSPSIDGKSLKSRPRASLQSQDASASSNGARPSIVSRGTAPHPIILIGASTGGVEALHKVLPSFPLDCPPVVVVQHIRGAFSSAFAERLNRICAAQVLEAQDGMPLVHGQIIVAPGDETHLHLLGRHPVQVRLVTGPPVTGHRPSVDALFNSALPLAGQVVAALLTGMGSDGARGLLSLRQAGAHTFSQDQETSTVYGMPRVAAELGAACRILPLPQIAPALLAAASAIAHQRNTHTVAPR